MLSTFSKFSLAASVSGSIFSLILPMRPSLVWISWLSSSDFLRRFSPHLTGSSQKRRTGDDIQQVFFTGKTLVKKVICDSLSSHGWHNHPPVERLVPYKQQTLPKSSLLCLLSVTLAKREIRRSTWSAALWFYASRHKLGPTLSDLSDFRRLYSKEMKYWGGLRGSQSDPSAIDSSALIDICVKYLGKNQTCELMWSSLNFLSKWTFSRHRGFSSKCLQFKWDKQMYKQSDSLYLQLMWSQLKKERFAKLGVCYR